MKKLHFSDHAIVADTWTHCLGASFECLQAHQNNGDAKIMQNSDNCDSYVNNLINIEPNKIKKVCKCTGEYDDQVYITFISFHNIVMRGKAIRFFDFC